MSGKLNCSILDYQAVRFKRRLYEFFINSLISNPHFIKISSSIIWNKITLNVPLISLKLLRFYIQRIP